MLDQNLWSLHEGFGRDLGTLNGTSMWKVWKLHQFNTFHVSLLFPMYPVNAFCPKAHSTGLQMGAKADTDCKE